MTLEYTDPVDWSDRNGIGVDHTMLNARTRDQIRALKTMVGAHRLQGLFMSSHPDFNEALDKVILHYAEAIQFESGKVFTSGFNGLVASMSAANGAGGIDTGAEAASSWYSKLLIRRTDTDAMALMLHKEPELFVDESQATEDASTALRDAAARTTIAQGFQTDEAAPLVYVAIKLIRTGAPVGQVWMTIESDTAGSPSGVVLATSHRLDAGSVATGTAAYVVFMFPATSRLTTAALTQYHFRLWGNWAIDGANYVSMRATTTVPYARGQVKSHDGAATWTGIAQDAVFLIGVLRGQTAVVMPAPYTDKALLGYVYNGSGSNLVTYSQRGRHVITRQSQQLQTGLLSTVPSLLSFAAVVPNHIPTTIWTKALVGAGSIYVLAPAPRGYFIATASAPGTAGMQKLVAGANGLGELGPIDLDVPLAHAMNNDAGATLYLSEWEW